MITFAVSGVIAFTSVFGAWGMLELIKTRISDSKSNLTPTNEDLFEENLKEKIILEPKHFGDSLTHVQHDLNHSTGDIETNSSQNNFEVVNHHPHPPHPPHLNSISLADSREEKKVSDSPYEIINNVVDVVEEFPFEKSGNEQQNKMNGLIQILETELDKKKEEEKRIRREQLTKLIEEERKRRENLEKIEKEKLEQKRLEEESRKVLGRESFALDIDQTLRSKKMFPSHQPFSFEWNFLNLSTEFEARRIHINRKYFDCIPESTLEFIKYHPRFIVDQPNNIIKLRYLTPYQGESKVTGYFTCSSCSRSWKISSSMKDTPFKCKHCNIDIYPHKQGFVHESEL